MTAIDPLAIFEAGVSGIKSMADGSPRFEFECGEDAIQYMTPLGQAKADKRYLMVIIYDYEDWNKLEKENSLILTDFDYETKKSPKSDTDRMDSRRISLRRD